MGRGLLAARGLGKGPVGGGLSEDLVVWQHLCQECLSHDWGEVACPTASVSQAGRPTDGSQSAMRDSVEAVPSLGMPRTLRCCGRSVE